MLAIRGGVKRPHGPVGWASNGDPSTQSRLTRVPTTRRLRAGGFGIKVFSRSAGASTLTQTKVTPDTETKTRELGNSPDPTRISTLTQTKVTPDTETKTSELENSSDPTDVEPSVVPSLSESRHRKIMRMHELLAGEEKWEYAAKYYADYLARWGRIEGFEQLEGDETFQNLSNKEKADLLVALCGLDIRDLIPYLKDKRSEPVGKGIAHLVTCNSVVAEFARKVIEKQVSPTTKNPGAEAKAEIEMLRIFAQWPDTEKTSASGLYKKLKTDILAGDFVQHDMLAVSFILNYECARIQEADRISPLRLMYGCGYNQKSIEADFGMVVNDRGEVEGRSEDLGTIINGWVRLGAKSFEDIRAARDDFNSSAHDVVRRFSRDTLSVRRRAWNAVNAPLSLVGTAAAKIAKKSGLKIQGQIEFAESLRSSGRHQIGVSRLLAAANYLQGPESPSEAPMEERLNLAFKFAGLFEKDKFADFAELVPPSVRPGKSGIEREVMRHLVHHEFLRDYTPEERKALICGLSRLKNAEPTRQAQVLLLMNAPKELKSPAITLKGEHYWVPEGAHLDKALSRFQALRSVPGGEPRPEDARDNDKNLYAQAIGELKNLYEQREDSRAGTDNLLSHFEKEFAEGKSWIETPMSEAERKYVLPVIVFYNATTENCRRDLTVGKAAGLDGAVNLTSLGVGTILGGGIALGPSLGGKVMRGKEERLRVEAWGAARFMIVSKERKHTGGLRMGVFAQSKSSVHRANLKLGEISGEVTRARTSGRALAFGDDLKSRTTLEKMIGQVCSRQKVSAADFIDAVSMHEVSGSSIDKQVAFEAGVVAGVGTTSGPSVFQQLGPDQQSQDLTFGADARMKFAWKRTSAKTKFRGNTNELRLNKSKDRWRSAGLGFFSRLFAPTQTALSATLLGSGHPNALKTGDKKTPGVTGAFKESVPQYVLGASVASVVSKSDNVRDITNREGFYEGPGRLIILKTSKMKGSTIQDVLNDLALPSLQRLLNDPQHKAAQEDIQKVLSHYQPGDTINVTYCLDPDVVKRLNFLKAQAARETNEDARSKIQADVNRILDSDESYVPFKILLESQLDARQDNGVTALGFVKTSESKGLSFREVRALVSFPPSLTTSQPPAQTASMTADRPQVPKEAGSSSRGSHIGGQPSSAISRQSWRTETAAQRELVRSALGETGWKNLCDDVEKHSLKIEFIGNLEFPAVEESQLHRVWANNILQKHLVQAKIETGPGTRFEWCTFTDAAQLAERVKQTVFKPFIREIGLQARIWAALILKDDEFLRQSVQGAEAHLSEDIVSLYAPHNRELPMYDADGKPARLSIEPLLPIDPNERPAVEADLSGGPSSNGSKLAPDSGVFRVPDPPAKNENKTQESQLS